MELALFERLKQVVLPDVQADPRHEDDQRLIEAFSPTAGLDSERARRIRAILDLYNGFMGTRFELRYYQVLALLFTEAFFERSDAGREESTVLAYWMATGSGKTLVMHLNLLQYLERLRAEKPRKVELVVTTPGINLIEQHRRELEPLTRRIRPWLGCPIEMTLETTQALLAYPSDYFDLPPNSRTQRVVIVDEAHIGLSTRDEGAFRRLRGRITRTNSFLFEYSATFRNLARAVQDAYEELIVFKYEYAEFFRDGYGKDYYFRRIGLDVADEERDNLREAFRILEKKLAVFEGLDNYGLRGGDRFPDRPLLAFMGNTVNDPAKDAEVTDVASVLRFLAELTPQARRGLASIFHGDVRGPLRVSHNRRSPDELLLSFGDGRYWGLVNVGRGDAFFADLDVSGLEKRTVELVPREYWFSTLDEPANGINVLVGSRKFAEGWNSFRLSVLGLINLGTARGNKIIQIFGRGVRLRGANADGKRRYVQHSGGYDSLGTGLDADVRRLETLVVVSLRRLYLETFVQEIEEETGVETSIEVPVRTRQRRLPSGDRAGFSSYRGLLPAVRLSEFSPGWVRVVLNNGVLDYSYFLAERKGREQTHRLEHFAIGIDLRADKLHDGVDVKAQLLQVLDAPSAADLVELDRRLEARCTTHRLQLYVQQDGSLRKPSVMDWVPELTHVRYGHDLTPSDGAPADPEETVRRAEAIAGAVIDHFVRRLRIRIEHDVGNRHYVLDEPLSTPRREREGDIPRHYSVSREFASQEELEQYEKEQGGKWRAEVVADLRLDAIGPHVYEPLVSSPDAAIGLPLERRAELEPITVRPDALNSGERKFVADLGEYTDQNPDTLREYELYLLRNVYRFSRIGLYLDSDERVFYPDFLLWAVERQRRAPKVHLCFVDPKGQTGMTDPRTLGSNAKVRLGENDSAALSDLGRRVTKSRGTPVRLHSFLLLRDSSILGQEESRRGDDEWLRTNLVERNLLRLDWHRTRENGDLSDFHSLFGGRSYLDLLFERVTSAA